jgi:hypothetical protein
MKTLSLQQMPNGFELEVPSFGYWVKAGAAFTLGAGTIGFALFVISWLAFGAVGAVILGLLRR